MLNEALRLVRVFHDIKQSQLAEMLGISRSYLSEIESGKKVASIDLLEKYAEIFEIPPSSLLLFSENIEKGIPSEKARVMFAKKIIKIMNWLSDTEDTKGGKYNKPA
jgi:transcriptional regulator with XRE-family HTH domain